MKVRRSPKSTTPCEPPHRLRRRNDGRALSEKKKPPPKSFEDRIRLPPGVSRTRTRKKKVIKVTTSPIPHPRLTEKSDQPNHRRRGVSLDLIYIRRKGPSASWTQPAKKEFDDGLKKIKAVYPYLRPILTGGGKENQSYLHSRRRKLRAAL